MSVATVTEIFRLVAPDFSEVSDDIVARWIELTAPLVSKKRFRKLYDQALALLTAHRMELAGAGVSGEDPLEEIRSISTSSLMRVASFSEGGTSVSFNGGSAQNAGVDAELALTPYGVQYLNLRRLMVISITSAGEG